MKPKSKLAWWPLGLAVFMAAWALSSLLPKSQSGLHSQDFGRLPVLLNGRVQPMDSVARNTLLQLRGKQKAPIKLHFSVFNAERRGQTMPAIDWLLEVFFKPSTADTRKVFRVDHPELVSLLRLPQANPDAGEDGKHYSFNQIFPSMNALENEARAANAKETSERTPLERQSLKLWSALNLYQRLKNSVKPEGMHDAAAEIAAFQASLPAGFAALQARQAGQDYDQEALTQSINLLRGFEPTAQMAHPLIIPPANPTQAPDDWENLGEAVLNGLRTGTLNPAVEAYAKLATAYHNNDTAGFNATLDNYQGYLKPAFETEIKKALAETRFNAFAPFYRALVVDVLAFLLICAYWIKLSENLRRAAVWLLFVGVLIHSSGLLYRMVLEGRPPVTNLYSSAIFIGWGSALLGLMMERIHRIGIGAASGSFIGFATLVIAHNLGVGGDTMEMMRAVLDSNFWLATHVVTITIGYSAMFLAGFFGILLLVLGPFTRVLGSEQVKVIGRLIYGIICFATLFSFVGTILGGIWADQSWGRFWGWDPKENGALLIVLWCAAMLHARWGGMVRERGMAAMAVFGNIVTSFSWFGVNMLGVGLHTYGFMDKALVALYGFIASQLIIMSFSLIPTKSWLSVRSPLRQTNSPGPRPRRHAHA
jgi:ABC-type transport system involved in cytochrome c biogenesis permease subunit